MTGYDPEAWALLKENLNAIPDPNILIEPVGNCPECGMELICYRGRDEQFHCIHPTARRCSHRFERISKAQDQSEMRQGAKQWIHENTSQPNPPLPV